MERIETTILRNLIFNEDYSRKVIPFIQPDYFEQKTEKVIFEEIVQFIVKYGSAITIEALNIEVESRTDLTEEQIKDIREINKSLNDSVVDKQWLLDTTEKWCRDRAIYLALMESIHIADGNNEKKNRDAIPSILSDALAVSFDNNIGHDYLQNYEERYDFYHRKEDKIEFDLDYFNKITKGGLPNKTLNIALAGTGVGKSLFMCHVASSVLLQGRNVLYITLEMAEERIAERIDANLLNVPIQQLMELPRQMFENKVTGIAKKTQGTLIIKEYPTASAHSGHFKALLNELALKKSFRPDIIFIDYLNICASSRHKANSSINSYSYIKSIAEELRGLAVEFNVPIVSATQTTRSGFGSSDVELTDTSESFGLPATADLMFALISTEELEQLGQIMVKQLKNRYNDPTIYKRFIVGIDRAKMRLYDCEQTAQKDILDSGQEEEYNDNEDKKLKKSFEGFKF
ncbi:DnaB-like replicative helicase [Synechococcus phage S-SRM01]|uniref:DnaB-like replicative helicase n=1 Tax=Synechococcus phage S-SRM01 TaxID=2781608 RepID=A0A879R2T3_9CAUD|nr:DnaB-like replicative helicase [Synechococcus phage S-SRM01]QPX48219.1 DNA primase/helicase [Synechococcus phage S-SRM01]